MPTRDQQPTENDVVYIAHFTKRNQLKVGTTAELSTRLSMQEKLHGKVTLLAVLRGSFSVEREIQLRFKGYAVPNRRPGGFQVSEWFYDNDEMRAYAAEINDAVMMCEFNHDR